MNNQFYAYSPVTREHTPVKHERAKALRRRMTHAELLLWFALKGERFNNLHFRRQQTIAGFIVDFYCHRLKLVIEVDGSVHDQTAEYDNEREQILTTLGMTVLHFRDDQVLHHLNDTLNQIAQTANKFNPNTRL